MTAMQLRAELFREMNPLLDNETAMMKVLAFLKGLVVAQNNQEAKVPRDGWATAAIQAHAEGEDKLLMDEIFAEETMEDWQW